MTKGYAELLREYGLSTITGDNYAAEWVETAFRTLASGMCAPTSRRARCISKRRRLFARGGISLPNHAVLLRELRLLERRTHRSGRDTVDHGAHGHDDYANAVLGCAALTMRGDPQNLDWIDVGAPVGAVSMSERAEFARRTLWAHVMADAQRSY